MSRVPLMTLVERIDDDGKVQLRGSLGRADFIAYEASPTGGGMRRWTAYLVEPDERALERRHYYAKRRAENLLSRDGDSRDRKRRDGVVELGGCD